MSAFAIGPFEMCLPARFILERVEDRKRGRAEPQREPQRRRRFLIGELKALLQERGDFRFLARLCLESHEQTVRQH